MAEGSDYFSLGGLSIIPTNETWCFWGGHGFPTAIHLTNKELLQEEIYDDKIENTTGRRYGDDN